MNTLLLLKRWLAAALLGTAAAVSAQTQAPAPSPDTVRPALAATINGGLELLAAGKFKEALAKVAEAETVPDRTPYENFVLDQLRGAAAAGAGDFDTAVRSFEAALATGRLEGPQALRIIEGLVGTCYRLKDYARTITWGQRYVKDGGSNPQVRRLLVNALVQQSDWAGASTQLLALVAEDEAAGRRPAEDQLRLLGSSQNKLGDKAAYQQTVERLLRHYPKPAYWRDRIAQLQGDAGFDNALMIDSYRLLNAVGAFEAASDYVALAELALGAGLPAEAQTVVNAGFSAGKLGTGGDAAQHQALRERANRLAAADAKVLDAAPGAPAAATSANALVSIGLALATSGRADRGLPLIEQALAKGSVTRPDVARLRLAWASAQSGRSEPAKALFRDLQGVGGSLGDLARLWLIQLDRPTGT